jgi:hypothetical protein
MALYMCTRFNYARREMETEGFEAEDDAEGCDHAAKYAEDHGWLSYEVRHLSRLVICHPSAAVSP